MIYSQISKLNNLLFNNKNHAIMKKVYLIDIIRNGDYKGTCHIVFSSKKAAEEYIKRGWKNGQIQKVNLVTLKDFIND